MNLQKLNKVKEVYSFWGRFPFLYAAQDIITFMGRAKTIRRKAVQALQLKKGGTVLEVACGSGKNFPYLVKVVGASGKIVGFDYSQEMLNAAQQLSERNGWNNIRLVQGDAAELKIQEKNFDGVISVLGISAVPDWEKALYRSYALLRPGGKLVVCDASLSSDTFKVFNPLVKIIYSKLAAWDPSKNIPEKIKRIFGNLEIKRFNFGTFFIAAAVKTEK